MDNTEKLVTLGTQNRTGIQTKQKTQHNMCWTQLDANKHKLHSYPDLHLQVHKCMYTNIARNTVYEPQDNENDDMNIRLQLCIFTCLIFLLEYKKYTNKTDRHNITDILLKVALNNITLPLTPKVFANIDGFLLIQKWCMFSFILGNCS